MGFHWVLLLCTMIKTIWYLFIHGGALLGRVLLIRMISYFQSVLCQEQYRVCRPRGNRRKVFPEPSSATGGRRERSLVGWIRHGNWHLQGRIIGWRLMDFWSIIYFFKEGFPLFRFNRGNFSKPKFKVRFLFPCDITIAKWFWNRQNNDLDKVKIPSPDYNQMIGLFHYSTWPSQWLTCLITTQHYIDYWVTLQQSIPVVRSW